jgi:hypothetical protein
MTLMTDHTRAVLQYVQQHGKAGVMRHQVLAGLHDDPRTVRVLKKLVLWGFLQRVDVPCSCCKAVNSHYTATGKQPREPLPKLVRLPKAPSLPSRKPATHPPVPNSVWALGGIALGTAAAPAKKA